MNILCFDPTSTTGPDGYINFKMSGGNSGGGGGGRNGRGCGVLFWIILIIFAIYLTVKTT